MYEIRWNKIYVEQEKYFEEQQTIFSLKYLKIHPCDCLILDAREVIFMKKSFTHCNSSCPSLIISGEHSDESKKE
jgi:hypothetical protein